MQKRPVAFKWLLPPSMAATSYFTGRICTVLVVEDEALIRDFLHIVLKRMGHVVLEACDGAEDGVHDLHLCYTVGLIHRNESQMRDFSQGA